MIVSLGGASTLTAGEACLPAKSAANINALWRMEGMACSWMAASYTSKVKKKKIIIAATLTQRARQPSLHSFSVDFAKCNQCSRVSDGFSKRCLPNPPKKSLKKCVISLTDHKWTTEDRLSYTKKLALQWLLLHVSRRKHWGAALLYVGGL